MEQGQKSLNAKISTLIRDPLLRTKLILQASLIMNLLYAIYSLIFGYFYKSIWLFAFFAYYAFLALSRSFLLKSSGKKVLHKTEEQRFMEELCIYRFCGYLLLGIQVVMSGVIAATIILNKSYQYPGHIIYLTAAFTFYCVIISVVNLFRFRLKTNPIISAEKILDLAASLMALFSLQTALLSRFGEYNTFQLILNASVGGVISMLVQGIAIAMIVKANRNLSGIKEI